MWNCSLWIVSVEYDIFESKWTQLAGRVVAQNTTLGQQDLRRVTGTDELLEQRWQLRTAVLTKDHPEKVCTLSIPGVTPPEIRLCGLLDTGTDIMILSLAVWPPEWPLDLMQTSVTGLAGMGQCYSPRTLTPEARQVLEEVQRAVSASRVYSIDPSIDVTVFITTLDLHPTGIIVQWSDKWSDSLHVLEWVFLPHQPQKTATALFELIAHLIIKYQQQCLQLMGVDPTKIILPVQREDFDWSFANSIYLQSALEKFSGQFTYHLPSHKLLQVAKFTEISLRPKTSQVPVQRPTVSTDGLGRTGKAIVTWRDGSEWQVLEGHEDKSAQLVELRAAVMAFQKFSQEPFNLVTDSAYVADMAQRLGHSVLKEVSNAALFHLLKTMWCAIQARVHPYCILHALDKTHRPRAKVQILVYAGNLQSVFVLTCDCKGKIRPIGKLETVTKMKVIKWMNHRVMTDADDTSDHSDAPSTSRY
ncbi:hypothetical protein DUI87_03070 [Hirundo rustica rustica]|uniref:Uncharacterized protein n=1 Tax=Hirundo rustica rustica TaxID=333673 RepID=A0A3M0LAZ1_HIRRU|nr:hypothetical protein DUI87_03070 [Hirundo rustica rustica]